MATGFNGEEIILRTAPEDRIARGLDQLWDGLHQTSKQLEELRMEVEALEVAINEAGINLDRTKLAGPEESEEPKLGFPQDKITCSCDCSIKKNPGGPASAGVCIRVPDPTGHYDDVVTCYARPLPPSIITNNQAEYAAVYETLNRLDSMFPFPHKERDIIIRTDSQLVANQLNGIFETKDLDLKRERDTINELLTQLSTKLQNLITVQWVPRNSDDDMKAVNYKAQEILGVRKH